jgi:di/tricarboxylate transporter
MRAALGAVVLAAMVGSVALGFVTMFKACLAAIAALGLARFLSIRLVKQAMEPRILLTIALSFALGTTLQTSGLAGAFAELARDVSSGSPWVALAIIHLTTALLTEMVTNNAAAALMVPLALGVADRLGVSHLPFMVSVMIAASASFATPIGYTTNLMVLTPGGYRFADFVKVGLPLNLLVAAVTIFLTPRMFPF